MKYRRFEPELDDCTVRQLHHLGQTADQIAQHGGWNPSTVKAAVRRLHISRPQGRPSTTAKELPPRSSDMNNPMAIAFLTFGDRLKEVNGSYRLDNTPIRFFDLMKRVNRVRKSNGQTQIGPEAWHA